MGLVTTKQILERAQKDGYAVGAFNVENMEMAQAVIEAASEARAPLIVQTTPSTVKYASVELFYANVAALARTVDVPVALHLDHGDSFELCVKALVAGYTSVMYDGSQQQFKDNIANTRRVVKTASAVGICVEAELGKVGGKEDDLSVEGNEYTDPGEAREFMERTGAFSLAIAIGTAHGVYAGVPVLDIERVRSIREVVGAPLVLHGASGVADEDVAKCIEYGICKVNFATELRIAFSDGVKRLLSEKPETFDPKEMGRAARENVKKFVMGRMSVCGCAGKY